RARGSHLPTDCIFISPPALPTRGFGSYLFRTPHPVDATLKSFVTEYPANFAALFGLPTD
ncbi:MAG: hypothetical protein ACRC1K_21125, partial [Planctomycetia bacterium]